jgi:hypothetical protein
MVGQVLVAAPRVFSSSLWSMIAGHTALSRAEALGAAFPLWDSHQLAPPPV